MKPVRKVQEKIQEKIFTARLNSQDSDVFADVYHFYVDRIYRYVYFKVSIHEDAEDLTSDVFFRTWQYIFNQKRQIEYLNAFLFQIARNTVVDYYRSKAKSQEVLADEEIMEQIDDYHQQNLLKQIDTKRDVLHIEKKLKLLRDEYREVILLKYVEELSTSEISRIINRSKGAVRILVHRALKELRIHLGGE